MRLDRGQIEVIEDIIADILSRKTHAERIKIGCDMWESAHKMLTVHLSKTHLDWTEERIQQEVIRRMSHGAV